MGQSGQKRLIKRNRLFFGKYFGGSAMPRLKTETLSAYRLNKQSGHAIVTLKRHDFLLGPHGTSASRAEYNRRISEWLAAGRQNPEAQADLTISALMARHKIHVDGYYRHVDGSPTSEPCAIQHALRPLCN